MARPQRNGEGEERRGHDRVRRADAEGGRGRPTAEGGRGRPTAEGRRRKADGGRPTAGGRRRPADGGRRGGTDAGGEARGARHKRAAEGEPSTPRTRRGRRTQHATNAPGKAKAAPTWWSGRPSS